MRMWMLPPTMLCRKHLLGEHVELHMLAGALRKGKSIAGHLARGQLEPQNIVQRHTALAQEMLSRGYKHKSPLQECPSSLRGTVDLRKSQEDLLQRCAACARRH